MAKQKPKKERPRVTIPECRECGRQAPVSVESGRCRKCEETRQEWEQGKLF
jgi:hypothetical protein